MTERDVLARLGERWRALHGPTAPLHLDHGTHPPLVLVRLDHLDRTVELLIERAGP